MLSSHIPSNKINNNNEKKKRPVLFEDTHVGKRGDEVCVTVEMWIAL